MNPVRRALLAGAALPSTEAPLAEWVFKSNIIDIALAGADFAAGKTLYDSWMREA